MSRDSPPAFNNILACTLAPEMLGMNLVPYMRSLQRFDVVSTLVSD